MRRKKSVLNGIKTHFIIASVDVNFFDLLLLIVFVDIINLRRSVQCLYGALTSSINIKFRKSSSFSLKNKFIQILRLKSGNEFRLPDILEPLYLIGADLQSC